MLVPPSQRPGLPSATGVGHALVSSLSTAILVPRPPLGKYRPRLCFPSEAILVRGELGGPRDLVGGGWGGRVGVGVRLGVPSRLRVRGQDRACDRESGLGV